MRDYEELVKALRDEDNCNVLDYIDDAADAIEELCDGVKLYKEAYINEHDERIEEIKRHKWISVEERLPESERKTYWVYTNAGGQHECRWTNNRFGLRVSDKWGWSVFDIPQYTVVTHWMPLPEPPKEDDNETP